MFTWIIKLTNPLTVHMLTYAYTHTLNGLYNEEDSIEDLGSTLCALCSSGDIGAVQRHLQNPDTDVNETDSTGEAPLHKACNIGNLDILKLLLKQDGIKISPRSDNGQTPLHIASRLGNLEAAELLIDAEPDKNEAKWNINMPDSKGLTPLCYAATIHQGREDMVKFLVERYFVVSNCTPVNEICSVATCSFCRGADLGSSLRSAATCSVWKTKDAEDLIKLCGGLTQNIEIISKV